MSGALRRLIAQDAVPPVLSQEGPMWTRIVVAGAPVAITVFVLVIVSYAGAGAGAQTDFEESFRAVDANRNGIIERSELITDMDRQIAEAKIPAACEGTEWEIRWTATPEQLADGHMDFYDADGDGRATLKEYIAAYERQRASDFVEADADNNGFVTKEEMIAAYRVDEVKVSAECRAAVGMQGAAEVPEIMEFLDADQDGKVSLREFVDH